MRRGRGGEIPIFAYEYCFCTIRGHGREREGRGLVGGRGWGINEVDVSDSTLRVFESLN